jgi:hypothetical protein
MKNLFKLFGIISLIAIIGCGMTSCKTTEAPLGDKSVATETGGRDDIPRDGILSYFGLNLEKYNAIINAGGSADFAQWTYQTIPGGRKGARNIGFPGLNLRWSKNLSPAAFASFKTALETQLGPGDLQGFGTEGVYSYGGATTGYAFSSREYVANYGFIGGYFSVTFMKTEDYSWK